MEECYYYVEVHNFTKSNTSPRMFFAFFELYIWYQITQSVSYMLTTHEVI